MSCDGLPWLQQRLTKEEWERAALLHRDGLSPQLDDYVYKRSARQKDPILDFLFEYYRFRPAQLKRWSPGFGVALQGPGEEYVFSHQALHETPDGMCFLDPRLLPPKRIASLRWMAMLLRETAGRPPSFGCYGLHEWAMVYRADAIRHEREPLRLSPEAIDAFVESWPIRCTHFDAWRFFTPDAKPFNGPSLSRDTQHENEQPGCLHANMDLYKWAYKLFPWVSSALLRDAFALAILARTIDMQASPYDMTPRGLEPICIETPEGREEYQVRQRECHEAAIPVRAALLSLCEQMLEVVDSVSGLESKQQ
jgi:hypothetical protein